MVPVSVNASKPVFYQATISFEYHGYIDVNINPGC